MFNCFDCGVSIDLAKMQDQEQVHCVSSQMDEVHRIEVLVTNHNYIPPTNTTLPIEPFVATN